MTTGLWEHNTQGINYDRYRPYYPTGLTNKVVPESGQNRAYLDVATGTGQLLFKLYNRFDKSFGVDLSEQMVKVSQAKAKEINLRQGNQKKIYIARKDCLHIHEVIGEDQKFELITVGEALHWFQIDEFLKYAKNQLLKEDGVLGVFGYYISRCEFLEGPESQKEEANDIYYEFYDMIEPYFAFRMKELDECYCEPKYTFADHFNCIERSVEQARMDIEAEDFVNFFKTYSGYNTFIKKTGKDVAEQMREKLKGRKVGMWVKYFLIKCSNTQ